MAAHFLKLFGNSNCAAPAWVGQHRVKAIFEASRACVMMTCTLQLKNLVGITAMELEK
jgi:hypothetical protein